MRPVTHGANWVQSARCPGATIRDSGRHIPSALRWILLVKPPRERPVPHLLRTTSRAGRQGSATGLSYIPKPFASPRPPGLRCAPL